MRTAMEALDAACQAVDGQANLASRLSELGPRVTSQAISDWRRRGMVPVERGEPIESMTGVRADELCPNVEWLRDKAGRIVEYRPAAVKIDRTRPASPKKKKRSHGQPHNASRGPA